MNHSLQRRAELMRVTASPDIPQQPLFFYAFLYLKRNSSDFWGANNQLTVDNAQLGIFCQVHWKKNVGSQRSQPSRCYLYFIASMLTLLRETDNY